MRWQFLVAPDVRAGDGVASLAHPETGATVTVPSAFLDVLPFADAPFTARELLERSGAPIAPAALANTLLELRAAGLVVPASSASARLGGAAFHPLAWLSRPFVALPLLACAWVGVAFQMQSILFFAREAVRGFRGAYVVPVLLATAIVPAARALFRRELLGGGAVRAKLRGVIPTWEIEHAPPATKLGRVTAHLSGFLFDALLANACVLTMRSKPFELGYAGYETPIAFLAVGASVCIVALNPLAKYDVYYAIEDALGVADLRGHARARLFQLLSRRRADASTIAYAAYFVLSIGYGLLISAGLLALAYAVSSKLFPAEAPLRLGLASALVGFVAWRAVRTVHRPVVRAFAARRRKAAPIDRDDAAFIALGPAITLSPSLHRSEGFPFAFALRESASHEAVHDFAALAPELRVQIVDGAAVDKAAAALDLDDPAVRALSLRMLTLPARALGVDAKASLAIASSCAKELPLERYEPVAQVEILDGTFKHGGLDVAARLRSASDLDVFRPLFAPLRSRHVVARYVITVAFRDRAIDRFTHFILVDRNTADARALRLATLRSSIERATNAVPASGGRDSSASVVAPTTSPATTHVAGTALDSRSRPPEAGTQSSSSPPPQPGTALDVLTALKSDATLAAAARLRKTSLELLRASHCAAVLSPVDVDKLPSAARAWGERAGLFFAETRAGITHRASQIRAPTLLLPTGRAKSPTGLKLRILVDEPFAARPFAPTARYELVSPHKNFLGDVDATLDAGDLPIWISDDGAGETTFAFDGELKAMACRHLIGLRAISTGGFNHPFAAPLARHLANEKSVTFVVDEEAPIYRRGRTDQLLDPLVRTLALASRVRALAPNISLHLMRGLAAADGKKLDLDEVAGLASSAQAEAIRKFRAHTGDAVDANALLHNDAVGPYVAGLCAFADRYYAALNEARHARCKGGSGEVRVVAAALSDLEERRKSLASLAGAARDVIRRAWRPRT